MKTLRNPFSLCVLVLFATLAGCGGGSGGSGGTGSISGRVSDLVALPAAGRAAGDAIRISVEGTTLSATTNPDGTFTISGVPPGLRTIIARTTTHAAAFCARVSPGGNTEVGEIALRESGQISGLVTSMENHRPISDARVTVTELIYTNTADVAPHPVRATKTNGSGSYTVDGLPAGEYLVSVDKEGFETESLMTYVSAFSTTPGDIQLHAADPAANGVMAGTAYLISEEGQKSPVAGVLVRVTPREYPDPIQPLPGEAIGSNGASVDMYPASGRSHSFRERYTFTDETGAYSLDGIPAGDYLAVAVRPGLEVDQKPVTITASGTTTIDFELQLRRPRVGTIEGRVVNAENGEPVANAHVSLLHGPVPMPIAFPDGTTTGGYSSPGSVGGGGGSPGNIGGGSGGIYIVPDEFDFYATTDAQGQFRMRAPAGEVLVDVYAEGYLSAEQTVQVPLRGLVTVEFRLTKRVTREVTLSGRVVAASSNGTATPVANATVYASPISDHYRIMGGVAGAESAVVTGGSRMHPSIVYQADTDSEGRFSLKLQTGVYYLYASKENLFSEPTRLEVANDVTHEFVMKEYTVTSPPNR